MRSTQFRFGICSLRGRHNISRLGVVFGVFLFALTFTSPLLSAQNENNSSAEFKRLVQELSTNRLGGGAESESQQQNALAFLDTIAVSVLNGSASPDLDAANQRLASLTSHTPPVGENYRLLKLGGTPTAYALVVNFGQGGPAAVRIYARTAGGYALAARIDQFSQKGFLDSDIELVPVETSNAVFVTVAGRTDDLSTGMFSAWRFDGKSLVALWSSDLLQQSNYAADGNGFHLTYCGKPDDDKPEECLQMTRDLYRFQDNQWKRIETADLPPEKSAVQPPAK